MGSSHFPFLLAFFLLPLLLPLASFLLGKWLRPRQQTAAKVLPYESGIEPEGAGNIQFHVAYWPVALLFVIFEAEAIFLFPWAVAYEKLRAVEGWGAFAKMLIFLAFLGLGLVYAWRRGVLRWERKTT